MRIVRSLGLLFVVIMVGGCATLFAPKQTTVAMNSNPVGASVFIDGVRIGTTPMSFNLENNRAYTVVFRSDSGGEVACLINRRIGTQWVVLDVLGGLMPVVVDAATGAWYQLDKNNCSVTIP